MLSQFQSSYQRVEQSMQRLTDSIAAYNPSPSAADELLAADEAVSANLEQLIEHQSNHKRILALRQTAQDLDETIKKSIKLLSDTRRDILAIPACSSSNITAIPASTGGSASRTQAGANGSAARGGEDGQPREIAVDELLAYAKFISRTTVPPTFRSADLPPLPASVRGKAGIVNGNAAGSPNIANANAQGGAAGAVAVEDGIKQEGNGDGGAEGANNANNTATQPQEAQLQQSPAANNENDEAQQWLNQSLPFEPWPSQGHLQMGILGDIQRMVESGKDPATVLTAEEQAEADAKRKELEEKEREAAFEAERRRMSLFDTGAGGGARRRDGGGDVFNPDDL